MNKYKFTLIYYGSRTVIKYSTGNNEEEAWDKLDKKWGHLIMCCDDVELVGEDDE